MYEKYEANLNIDGTGAIVAAPDLETPGTKGKNFFGEHVCRTGGSYYYHWMRDAGLSIKAWMDINDNDYERVRLKISFNQPLLFIIHPVSGCS